MTAHQLDVGLNLQDTHVVVTGGAGLIGRVVVSAFLSAGAKVTSLDLAYPETLSNESQKGQEVLISVDSELDTSTGEQESTRNPLSDRLLALHADTADERQLGRAWAAAISRFGPVQCCIALAAKDLSVLPHVGLVDMEPKQWMDTFRVNVGATMLVARQWLRGLRDAKSGALNGKSNISLIMVGSESGWFGEKTNPDYAASKAAVQVGLLQSLRAEVPRLFDGARLDVGSIFTVTRVNAIAPGPVDTVRFRHECAADPDQYYIDAVGTVALGKPVPVESVAKSILYLASDNLSGNFHGQVLNVDSGKQGKLIWMKGERQ